MTQTAVKAAFRGSGRSVMIPLAVMTFSLIALLRNAGALSYPIVYAEDAIWLGEIMTQGFWSYAFHGRGDFPVVGLLALEQVAILITRTLFTRDLSMLPMSVAIVASLTLGLISTLPLICLHKVLPTRLSLILGLAMVLLPMGHDGNEIFGRILNLGFYAPVAAVFVLAVLLYASPSRWAVPLLHAAALLLMWTFPVVIAQYAFFICFLVLQRRQERRAWILNAVACTCVLLLGVAAVNPAAIQQSGGIPVPFRLGGLVELAFARTVLFPFVAALYLHLSDVATLLLALLFASVLGVAFVRARRDGLALIDYRVFFLINGIIVLVVTIVMRRGLTSFLQNYTTTFPDRYFTGLNVIWLVIVMLVVTGDRSLAWRRAAGSIFVLTVASWLFTQPLISRHSPTSDVVELGTFRDVICARAAGRGLMLTSPSPNIHVLPVYPVDENYDWRIRVPDGWYRRTVHLQCGSGTPQPSVLAPLRP